MKGAKIRFLKLNVLFILLNLIFSCKIFNNSVVDYMEYWTNTVCVGRFEPQSFFNYKDGINYLSAQDTIVINMYVSNPKKYSLNFSGDSAGSTVSFYYEEDGEMKTLEATTTILDEENTIIKITGDLLEETEKKKIYLKGSYGINKEDSIETEKVDFEWSFIQSTPPDSPASLKNPEQPENDGYHCLHFKYPNEAYKKNRDLSYDIECYLKKENGEYEFIDEKILTKKDTKAPSNTKEFIYYFDLQEKNLQYEYRVTFYNSDGIKGESIATAEGLGVCKAAEPEINFSNGIFKGLGYDNEEKCQYEIYDYSYLEADGLNYSIKNIDEDVGTANAAQMVTYIDGTKYTEDEVKGQFSSDGVHTIRVELSKNLCKTIVIEKKIKVYFKPVTVEFNGIKMSSTRNDAGDTNEYYGYYYLEDEYMWGGDKLDVDEDGDWTGNFCSTVKKFLAKTKDSSYKISLRNWYESDSGGDDNVGTHNANPTLRDLKACTNGYYTVNGSEEKWYILFKLSD